MAATLHSSRTSRASLQAPQRHHTAPSKFQSLERCAPVEVTDDVEGEGGATGDTGALCASAAAAADVLAELAVDAERPASGIGGALGCEVGSAAA